MSGSYFPSQGESSRHPDGRRLVEDPTIDVDSGYGGSMADDMSFIDGEAELPRIRIPLTAQGGASTNQQVPSHILQLYYNQNRVSLDRSISRCISILDEFQNMNSQWPAHYPSNAPQPEAATRAMPHALQRSQSSMSDRPSSSGSTTAMRPGQFRRSFTTGADETQQSRPQTPEVPEPRLVSPQIINEFNVLKLDLKLNSLPQSSIVHSLDKGAVAAILDGKITQAIKHLRSLQQRLEDTSSRVLVTGDLNAGKSTFCNALLRRNVLPEDQMPFTEVFCEVLDAKAENDGREEVHAIFKDGAPYNRYDESTYDVYSLKELEKVVVDGDKYMMCKIYILDTRPIDQSLVSNGIVNISLIDAPGLNRDSLQTTAVFARQEEIDVVVFVVSAENQFTLSAQEFLWNAANEKAYVFIVVNKYESIRDKARCKKAILEQVKKLSPRTWEGSGELVHFVSAGVVVEEEEAERERQLLRASGQPGDPGDDDDDEDDEGDDEGAPMPHDDGKKIKDVGLDPEDEALGDADDEEAAAKDSKKKKMDKGKSPERDIQMRDFSHLEQSLRSFVLEKRARSKLAPAKTYLVNLLNDLETIGTANVDVAARELERVNDELSSLLPEYERTVKAKTTVSEALDKTVEESAKEVFENTRNTLDSTIQALSQTPKRDTESGSLSVVQYNGFLNAYAYAEATRAAMLDTLAAAVATCETFARDRTVGGVASISAMGISYIGSDYVAQKLRPEVMFNNKKDKRSRVALQAPVSFSDFFDLAHIFEKQEKAAGLSLSLSVATVAGGQMLGISSWFDGALKATNIIGLKNAKSLILPALTLSLIAAGAWIVSDIPNAVPRKLSRKLAAELDGQDYVLSHSTRLAREVRTVLRIPGEDLRGKLQSKTESKARQKDGLEKIQTESEVARKYFGNLVRGVREQRNGVERIDLDVGLGMGVYT